MTDKPYEELTLQTPFYVLNTPLHQYPGRSYMILISSVLSVCFLFVATPILKPVLLRPALS